MRTNETHPIRIDSLAVGNGPNPTLAAKTANVRFKQNQRARYVANLETRLLDNYLKH